MYHIGTWILWVRVLGRFFWLRSNSVIELWHDLMYIIGGFLRASYRVGPPYYTNCS